MTKARGIITASMVITLIVGTLNSIDKYDKLPKLRFYFGTGILYLMLEGLAEFEDEIAKAIAIAVVTFTVLGEGGGVVDRLLGKGTAKTTLNTTPKTDIGGSKSVLPGKNMAPQPAGQPAIAVATRVEGGVNAAVANGLAPIKPLLS